VIEVRSDITGRKDIEKRLVQTERLAILGFLAASVAHQLNTPLATLSALIEAMGRDEKVEEHRFGRMTTALYRLKELGRQLVFLSMAPEEKQREINLGQIIERSIRIIEKDFHRQNISTTMSIPKEKVCLLGYPYQVEQILLNVLMNAMQAMPEGGALTVTLDVMNSQASVTIEDTGTGIREADLERVFHPTFTTKGKKGTGFGLFLVKNFIENMGGHVNIESKPEMGTKVLLSFPGGHLG
jgi:signal transduction histidine kinase